MSQRSTLLMIFLAAAVLQGCATAVVTGAATGAAVVHDRRTAGSVIEDESIEIKALRALYGEDDLWKQVHVNFTSYNGVVLVTGEAPTMVLRARVERLIRAVPKVRDVHNEVSIAAPSSLLTRSSDALITSKIKTFLLTDKGLDPSRIKVVTENGVVYLMGLVARHESKLATEVASSTSGVQRVVRIFEYLD